MDNLIKIQKYGVLVWCNEKTDNLRREQCLCLNCGFSNNGCDAADSLYEICKNKDIALMVTRCPKWTKEINE